MSSFIQKVLLFSVSTVSTVSLLSLIIPLLKVLVANTFDKMLTVVNCVPRVESKLYPSEQGFTPAKPNLSPTISPQLLTDAKAKVLHYNTHSRRTVKHTQYYPGSSSVVEHSTKEQSVVGYSPKNGVFRPLLATEHFLKSST